MVGQQRPALLLDCLRLRADPLHRSSRSPSAPPEYVDDLLLFLGVLTCVFFSLGGFPIKEKAFSL